MVIKEGDSLTVPSFEVVTLPPLEINGADSAEFLKLNIRPVADIASAPVDIVRAFVVDEKLPAEELSSGPAKLFKIT